MVYPITRSERCAGCKRLYPALKRFRGGATRRLIREKEEEEMIQPTAGFIVYGVHKDGLQDPMGRPFIDDQVVARSKKALIERGLRLIEHDVVVATKQEARAALKRM